MQTSCYIFPLHVMLFFLSGTYFQIQGQAIDELDNIIQTYLTSHNSNQHSHRHTRECQHVRYGNVTRTKYRVHGYKSKNVVQPVAKTRHAIVPEGLYYNQRDNQVHFTIVNNPLSTVSVLEPGSIGGCEDQMRSTVVESAKQKNCLVAINAGFFNTHNGSCLGNVISDGILVLNSEGVQNAHFGITKDGHLFIGYLSEIDLIAEQFNQLVGGVIWIIRDGKQYISESLKIECQDTEETGKLGYGD